MAVYITQQRLKSILSYDMSTGNFTWLVAIRRLINKGQRAGFTVKDKNGIERRCIKINGIAHYASKLAWLYVMGSYPKEEVDHINRNSMDDSFCNLRLATRSQNQANKCKYKHSKSPYKGITQRRNGKWVAQISREGSSSNIGTFNTALEAARAYDHEAKLLYGNFANLNGV